MKNKHETNVEFITRVMEFAKTGPMLQAVVLEGLRIYTDNVIKDETKLLKLMENSMISGPAWIASCKELNNELKQRTDY